MPNSANRLRNKGFVNQRLSPCLPALIAEVATLLDLKAASRNVRPGQEIISEGRPCSAVFLFMQGVAMRYRILRDGQRQILNFLLPGDFAGFNSCRYETALYSVKTLTPATVSPVPLARLVGLFDSHPRLAAKLFWSFSREATIYAEHLIAIGRRPAPERIAHLLLELLVRLQLVGLADERSYHLPLTQEMLSDALGLSVPYVNRVLQQLRADGLVRIKDQTVVIDDLEGLSSLADFERSYLQPMAIADFTTERVEELTPAY